MEYVVNGELLQAAERAGFDLLLTTDQNLVYQPNLTSHKIAIVALSRCNVAADGEAWKLQNKSTYYRV